MVYLAAFAAMLEYVSHLDNAVVLSLPHLWIFPLGAVGIAVLGTLAPIARYGNAGGSIYVLPTILHVVVLVSLLSAIIVTRP